MKLSQINVALNHKIVGGNEYQWSAWGPNARFLDYESDFAHAGVVFDTVTGTVYQAELSIKEEMWPEDHAPYRWLNPEYSDAYYQECLSRGIDHQTAWDEVRWIDLEVADDWLEKAGDIFAGADWDTRVQIAVEFSDQELLRYMQLAHERDITFNQLIEDALRAVIKEHKNNL